MQTSFRRAIGLAAVAFVGLWALSSPPMAAQSRNPIQAAKDAFKKAREEQERAKGQQPPPPTASQPAPPPSAAPPIAAAGAQAPNTGDCCSPEAIRRLAASLGFVDIVGIKLGMTPEQAIAAIKASNAGLRVDVLKTKVVIAGKEMPPERQWVIAHTVAPRNPVFFHQPDGTAESITLELTTPRGGPEVVGEIMRFVNFPNTAPVAATNLVEAVRQKYGATESFDNGLNRYWVFDESGKQVKWTTKEDLQMCVPNAPHVGFPFEMRGGQEDPSSGRLYQEVSTTSTSVEYDGERSAKCPPYTWVEAFELGSNLVRSQPQMIQMWISLQNPALLRNAKAAAHAFLKQADDAARRQQEDAASKRTAPKL